VSPYLSSQVRMGRQLSAGRPDNQGADFNTRLRAIGGDLPGNVDDRRAI